MLGTDREGGGKGEGGERGGWGGRGLGTEREGGGKGEGEREDGRERVLGTERLAQMLCCVWLMK